MDREYLKLEKKEIVLVTSLILGVFLLLVLSSVRNERIRQQSQAQTPAEISVQVLSPLSDVELSGTTASVELRANTTNGTQVLYDAQAQGEAAVLEFMDKNPVVDVAAVSDSMQVKGASTNPELKRVLPNNFRQNSKLARNNSDRMNKDKREVKHYYYTQKVNGLPVYGATVRFDLANNDKIVGVDGDYTVSQAVPAINLTDQEAEAKALQEANTAVRKDDTAFTAVHCSDTPSAQIIYNKKIIGISDDDSNRPALQVSVCDQQGNPQYMLEYIVALDTGEILAAKSKVLSAKNRTIKSCKETTSCNTAVRSEGQAAVSDTEANKSYDILGSVYDFYFNSFGRDSYNGAGAPIKGNIHFNDGGCPNAYWSPASQAMYACTRMVNTDVWAHELTHGVTNATSNLNDGQAGALNESISDMVAVSIDDKDWTINEEGGFIIRDLAHPENAPDGMRKAIPTTLFSSGYDCSVDSRHSPPWYTNGEPHHNANIPNKAFYLMAAGGTHNGCTVNGIGRQKAIAIIYKTNTIYLRSSSNFLDFNNKVNQSCGELYGESSSECANVKAALQATEMDQQIPGQKGPTCSGVHMTRKTPACAGTTQPTIGPSTAATPTPGNGSTSTNTPTPEGPGDPTIAVIKLDPVSGSECTDSTGATNMRYADYLCSNGFKGRVGDTATCKPLDYLQQQADFACAHSGPAATATATPTPVPGTGGTNVDPTRTPVGAYLQLNPSTAAAQIGDTVRLDVILNAGSAQVLATDALIRYDKNYLEAIDIIEGNYMTVAKTDISTPSQVYISGIVDTGNSPVTGSGKLATVLFKVKANGSSTVSFYCIPGETANDSNIATYKNPTSGDIRDIIQCSSNGASTISAGKGVVLNLALKFQGISSMPARNGGLMTARVGITGGELDTPASKLAQFQADNTGTFFGSVEFPDVSAASGYRILVKGPTHIQKKICHTNPLEQVTGEYRCANSSITLKNGDNDLDFSNIRILVGDVDQNGVVNSFDLAFVYNSIRTPTEANLEKCDVNWDGVCNGVDYGLMGAAIAVKTEDD